MNIYVRDRLGLLHDLQGTFRPALVARHAVRLQGLDELLAVSRRQLPAVREAIRGG